MDAAPAAWHRAPPWASGRPRRTSAQRRAQHLRAEGRVCQRLLRAFAELRSHRGGGPTQLGAALAGILGGTSAHAEVLYANSAVQTDKANENTAQADLRRHVAVQTVHFGETELHTAAKKMDCSSQTDFIHDEAWAPSSAIDEPMDAADQAQVFEATGITAQADDIEAATTGPLVAPSGAPSTYNLTADSDSDLIETLDQLLWPLLPLYGARAATMEVGGRAYGTITSVDQTVSVPHVLLYVLDYDDGDRIHLDALGAEQAVALALANISSTPLRGHSKGVLLTPTRMPHLHRATGYRATPLTLSMPKKSGSCNFYGKMNSPTAWRS